MPHTPHDRTAPWTLILLAACLLGAGIGGCRRDAPAEPSDDAPPTAEAAGTAPADDGMAKGTAPADDAVADNKAPRPIPGLAAALTFHPTDVDRAWFTLERGLVTTTDGGLNWAVVEGLKATTSQRFYVMTAHDGALFSGGKGLLLASVDEGATWAPVATYGEADVRGLATDPMSPKRLLALIANTGLVATIDGGATWQTVTGNLPTMAYGLWALSLDPPQLATVDRADGTVHVSADGGGSWRPLEARGLPGEVLGFAPGDGIAYAATDAGLQVSTNDGRSWKPRGPFKALITVASAPDDRATVLVVVPGGQVYRSRDRGVSWFDPNAPTRTPTAEATPVGEATPTAAPTDG